MRILLAGKYSPFGPKPIGGLQSWIKTVYSELEKEHDVDVWEAGKKLPLGNYDLGILANYGDTYPVWPMCKRIVNVSHGIIEAEKPGPADINVFTSEGVRKHWGMQGKVIRQPIDLDFWKDQKAERTLLLRYSYRAGLPWIADLAKDMGLEYAHVRNVTHEQARDYFSKARVVLATGRAALEAMSCGAPTVICDHRSAYQGPLMFKGLMIDAMKENYSGRGGITPTKDAIIEQIKWALAVENFRQHVEVFHDSKRIVRELLKL